MSAEWTFLAGFILGAIVTIGLQSARSRIKRAREDGDWFWD